MDGEYKWEVPSIADAPAKNGDIRKVNIPVEVLFEWSDKIATDWDENGKGIEFVSGYIMKVLPNQYVVYNGQPTIFLAQALINK